ncbi:DUF2190 family protein [Azospirillum sp. Sh1]|uniref:DUF2190 family protein n=1 Tax=Azospirillum sp. Sh1 TaxID=2607285 RepID=UPI0011EF759C|nr:DUF2190 family protein [Azospirillum sp. Sh1]KAA0571080.1 DUF2190 family protein [Azospirillum sp. Sh1]
MRNFIFDGRSLPFTAAYAVASGDGYLLGAIFGVVSSTAGAGEESQLRTEGCYALAKTATGITAGAPVYWDATARKVTGTASGNLCVGAAISAAGASAPTVRVKLGAAALAHGESVTLHGSGPLDFPSIAAAGHQDLTLAVAGAAPGDGVVLALPAVVPAGLVFQAWVSAADTVTVRATNITAAATDPAALTIGVIVHPAP